MSKALELLKEIRELLQEAPDAAVSELPLLLTIQVLARAVDGEMASVACDIHNTWQRRREEIEMAGTRERDGGYGT